ncbi:MAG: amidohydrolase family protein [Burkholderiales bacterium]
MTTANCGRTPTCWRTAPSPRGRALLGIDTAHAQIPAPAPDTILINGKFVVYDGAPAQALAVRNGKIAAIGDASSIRALAGRSTRVIDLGGRTVIPGLIDSHIHAIRAGLSYTTEVHWFGVRTLKEALDRIRAAAQTAPQGSWLVVAGGWTDRQFRDDRRPTQAEIAAAAPDHHVYVQLLYSDVLLDPGGADALGIGIGESIRSRSLSGLPLRRNSVCERAPYRVHTHYVNFAPLRTPGRGSIGASLVVNCWAFNSNSRSNASFAPRPD